MVAINGALLKTQIIDAAVTAVNATAYLGADRARRDVPVRKVFTGGRQTVRFKTAVEIEADKALRSRLGLAPEILASAKAVGRVQAAGFNPRRGRQIGGQTYGFARIVTHRNRANTFQPRFGGENDVRLLSTHEPGQLAKREYEQFLSGRGRHELKKGRATSGKIVSRVDLETGQIRFIEVERPRVGGGLRSTIRVEEASASQYPVIKASLVAGDKDHDYAIHQELGNRHNPAHPFLRPRLPEWRRELPEELRRSLGRLGR